uniref:TATA box-binding protein-associated factor RNA polymerase I subunit B n=1 Tax=Acrobeloides nanus TaxID=290746 RepID=A0A914D691_9BILA
MTEICPSCGSRSFSIVEGFYYCDVCNSQSQRREIDVEVEDESGAVIRGLRSKRTKTDGRTETQQKVKQAFIDPTMIANERSLYEDDFPKFLSHTGDNSLRIVQSYFCYFGVAFTDMEVASRADEKFILIFEKTKGELRALKRENERKRREEARENKKKANKNVEPTTWDELVSQPIELMEKESDMIISEDLCEPERFETDLSKTAIAMAGKIYLDIDMVISILYLSCLLSGCRWIMLNDIYRWYREERLPISKSQLAGLEFSTDFKEKASYNHVTRISKNIFVPNLPLYESLRLVSFCVQYLPLPKSIHTLDFNSVLSRIVWHLNLPKSFLHRLNVLLQILPEAEIDLGQISCRYNMDKNFLDKIKSIRQIGQELYFPDQRCLLLSPETKAIAVILFALKMMFGINNRCEDLIKPSDPSSEETFIFTEWMLQLQMRLASWKGISPNVVLNKGFDTNLRIKNSSSEFILQNATNQHRFPRFVDFDGCIPKRTSTMSSEKLFGELFDENHRLTALEDWSNEALFAPLTLQASMNRNLFREELQLGEDSRSEFDQRNVKLFFKSYENSIMEYSTDELVEFCDNSFPIRTSSQPNSENSNWKLLFPCSSAYQRYPRPENFTALVRYLENSEPSYLPILDTYQLELIYTTAEKFFSENFAQLLLALSMVIGELPSVVYFSFLMVELMVLDKNWLHELEADLRNGQSFVYMEERAEKRKDSLEKVNMKWQIELSLFPSKLSSQRWEYEYMWRQSRKNIGKNLTSRSSTPSRDVTPKRNLSGEMKSSRKLNLISDSDSSDESNTDKGSSDEESSNSISADEIRSNDEENVKSVKKKESEKVYKQFRHKTMTHKLATNLGIALTSWRFW